MSDIMSERKIQQIAGLGVSMMLALITRAIKKT